MMVFIIPVKSKTVTSDWSSFSRLVNRCINSVCNQLNTNFKVLVPCHEIPETDFTNDSRVEFIEVDFSPPTLNNSDQDLWAKRVDKSKKIEFASEYAIRMGAPYIMTVDSDDCISNRICSFVSENGTDSILGWHVKKGYLYPEGKKYSYLNLKNFHEICGSCVIMKPEFFDLMIDENFWFKHERTTFENEILLPLPFPGAIYSMLNGTNIRLDSKEMKERTKFNLFRFETIKTLFRRLNKYRLIPLVFIKKEFSIYDVSSPK